MSARISDEREHRRGLVLGLTLAEILLLLLFLLLLALASQLQHWQSLAKAAETRFEVLSRSLDQLKPLQEALMSGGANGIASVEQLIQRFQTLTELERQLAVQKEENTKLLEQSSLVRSLDLSEDKLRALVATMRRAAEIDPSDPPATLHRAVEVLARLGKSTEPEQVRPLSEMLPPNELSSKVLTLEVSNEKLRREKDNLMISGKGLSYPSCWINSAGQTEFIFDVTFLDSGVRVSDATSSRAQDPAWAAVSNFPRNSEINERSFLSATNRLASWSREQKCRFYTRNIDGTSPTNKDRYKSLQRQVEQNFYPYYVTAGTARSTQRPGTPKSITPATQTTPVEQNSSQ
ncbi:hypothetical protein [Bradyrhizobium sp. 21]|uniref:hypothetical protein n=1 Tax=Bradyrhizobium sp. 21 TaxID=2782666 RepID=UPI001FF7A9B9|nr:hypothetical protein [Bradyrhizobium sp. 21]MCK1388723.1 hypothetical protein [Bradyrhizobium sp. 21]